MSGLLHYLAGYLVDSFRERLAVDDLRAEHVRRVRVAGEADEEVRALVARMLPAAEVVSGAAEAVVIPMRGGAVGPRLWALLGRARHKLLVPSPHYIYRFGMRRGFPALLWAITDRLLLAPVALLWLGVMAGWMYLSGLAGAAREPGGGPPARVLLIRLAPIQTMAYLLRRLRQVWPSAEFAVVTASPDGEEGIAAMTDRVLLIARLGVREVLRRVRRFSPDVTIVAGGAGYGLGPTYLKAVVLAALSGAPGRWQWEPGEAVDRPLGGPMTKALRRAMGRWQSEPRATPGEVPADTGLRRWVRKASRGLGGAWRRRYYRRPPTCGPREVQIAVTAACNYHCLMCAFHNPAVDDRHQEAQLPRMSYEMFERLATDLRRHRVMLVGLTGYGEPLTHPHAMEMIACALELGLYVVPTTNASLLTEERARRLVDLGLPRLHVSLNAGTDETYAKMHPGTPPGRLGEIVRRLRWMAEYAEKSSVAKTVVRVSSVITRLNMHEIPELVRAAHQARSGELRLLLMSPVDGQEELLPRPDDWPPIRQAIREARLLGRELGVGLLPEGLEEEAGEVTPRHVYERIPCYMGYEVCQVIADGSVLFCAECLAPLGNLHESDFTSIWGSKAYQQARRAAMDLPRTRTAPGTCRCFEGCCHTGSNLDIHRWLYGSAALRGIG